ncbi:hypothetical protein CWE09_07815 [Aliidiomarina minuta]|uniref:Uncharacterized protein n=1 Tax=Aliidiomarina minuta TaxID=880057 RepID=A0A432W931_9GAMM|nr:hypothetical protein CWE09_07815 [Aliidiomarina minuta]
MQVLGIVSRQAEPALREIQPEGVRWWEVLVLPGVEPRDGRAEPTRMYSRRPGKAKSPATGSWRWFQGSRQAQPALRGAVEVDSFHGRLSLPYGEMPVILRS